MLTFETVKGAVSKVHRGNRSRVGSERRRCSAHGRSSREEGEKVVVSEGMGGEGVCVCKRAAVCVRSCGAAQLCQSVLTYF